MSKMKGLKMPRMAAGLKEEFEAVVPDDPSVTKKPMFGNLSAFVNGNMFAGVFGDGMFVRLPDDARARIKTAEGSDFEVMPGRAMNDAATV